MNPLVIAAGAAAVVAIGAGTFMLAGSAAPDRGAGTQTVLPDTQNVPQNDQMTAVNGNEASRRATVNNEDAQRARDEGRSYQSPSVITGVGPADRGETPDAVTANTQPEPPQERVIKETTERTVYVTPVHIEQPVQDQDARAAIKAQIDALARGSGSGGSSGTAVQRMVRTVYAAPPPPPEPQQQSQQAARAAPPAPRNIMMARTGDVIFARLDRAFNSDDPGAPIIVSLDDVIHDPDRGTRAGPLTGMRLVGRITYSDNQAAISFEQIVTNTGQQYPIQAIAVSEMQARTGVASTVDRHLLQRYGGLFLSSIIQGVGQVGQELVQNNRTIAISDGVIASSRNPVNYTEAGLAALQPLGQNLSQAAGQNFSRPPTMSAPAGMGLGVVFLTPVLIPQGVR